MTTKRHRSARIFAVPAGLALISCLGLASALMGNGVWNVVSWTALALPLAVIVGALIRSRPN